MNRGIATFAGISLCLFTQSIAQSIENIPVPTPRREAVAAPEPDTGGAERENEAEIPQGERPSAPEPPAKPAQLIPIFDLSSAKACEAELRQRNVQFRQEPPVTGTPPCGWQRPLRLISLPGGVEAKGEPLVNCKTGLALAKWVAEVVAPSASVHLDSDLKSIRFSTSYQCRRRNNASSGKYSEHAFANAVDITGFELADGRHLPIMRRQEDEDGRAIAFQAAARGGACGYFATVLGPGTNAAHATHFHLDRARRRGGYRLCE